MIQKLLLIGLAGAVGTLARYGLSGFVQRFAGGALPWGTLVVNVAGCFIAGLIWALIENRITVSGETKAIILIGFIGAFTTFSTFVLETGELMRDAEWFRAFGNFALQNIVGVLALFAGIAIARYV